MRISDWSSDVCSSDLNPSSACARNIWRISSGMSATAASKRRRSGVSARAGNTVEIFTQARTRSEEHTSELQSLMRISYAVFCLNKKTLREKYKHHIIKHN